MQPAASLCSDGALSCKPRTEETFGPLARRPDMAAHELASDRTLDVRLNELANDVEPYSESMALRLNSLAESIADPASVTSWAGIDVVRAIDSGKLAERVRAIPLVDVRLAQYEGAR